MFKNSDYGTNFDKIPKIFKYFAKLKHKSEEFIEELENVRIL